MDLYTIMDNLSALQRSHTMRSVRSSGSSAEMKVRKLCRELGFPGYRLNRRDLPGTPDIAYIGRRLAIFVHGCFWHGHSCKAGSKIARTNADYWRQKIERNVTRDARTSASLVADGWRVLVVWECELKSQIHVKKCLAEFLERGN